MHLKNRATLPEVRLRDPFFDREQKRYGQPLPSREYISQILSKSKRAIRVGTLLRKLAIRKSEQVGFEVRLEAMARAGQVEFDRRRSTVKYLTPIEIQGTVQLSAHRPYGFLVPEDSTQQDIYLPAHQVSGLMNGDTVVVRVRTCGRSTKQEGEVLRLIQRKYPKVSGTIFQKDGLFFLNPIHRKIKLPIQLTSPVDAADIGQIACVTIEAPLQGEALCGKLVKILGSFDTPGIEVDVALNNFSLASEFSDPSLLQQLSALPTQCHEKDIQGRKDLRQVPFVTIDGADAKDFDDAVFCKFDTNKKQWNLLVAIADVSHYIQPGDPLDLEAQFRGTSVYFPREVLPMLPEALSNHLCSIKPNQDRLVLVCDMVFDKQAKLQTYTFYTAVICSHARLTYDSVWQLLQELQDEPESSTLPDAVQLENLKRLYALYQALRVQREQRGAIDFRTPYTCFHFNQDQALAGLSVAYTNDAHRVIEECMLAANVCAADFLISNKIPGIFRVHEPPSALKEEALANFLSLYGINLKPKPSSSARRPKKTTPKHYQAAVENIMRQENGALLQPIILRTLQQARYQEKNCGHFGLAYKAYTHFTSPIRRYPDLVVHRLIKAHLAGQKVSSLSTQALASIAQHNSVQERSAEEASRYVAAWYKCRYLEAHIGEQYVGHISAINRTGLFISLQDTLIEGLLPLTKLGEERFEFNDSQSYIVGKQSGKTYRIGMQIRVCVTQVDIHQQRINFSLAT